MTSHVIASTRAVTRLPLTRGMRFCILAWAGSRFLVFAVGEFAAHRLVHAVDPSAFSTVGGRLASWAHWDGAFYTTIGAQGGYGGQLDSSAYAFFPGYPLLIHVGTWFGGGPAATGVVLSTLAALFAIFFCYRLAEDIAGERAAQATALAIAFFPTAFFLNAVYTESLFIALAAGSLWALRIRGNVLLAATLCGLATATRDVGVLLLLPLGEELWRRRPARLARIVALVPVAVSGIVGYAIYLWVRTGSPLTFITVQHEKWHRQLTNPISSLRLAWSDAHAGAHFLAHPTSVLSTTDPVPAHQLAALLNLLALCLVVALLGVALAKRLVPLGWWVFGAAVMLPPLLDPPHGTPLQSYPRFVLSAFPLFVVGGRLLARNRALLVVWLVVSGVLAAYLTAAFVTGRWVA